MEFMPNGDLQRYIDEETFLTEPEAAIVTRQVATALRYMHIHAFAHRDLKPSVCALDLIKKPLAFSCNQARLDPC